MSKKTSQQKITVKYNKCQPKNLYFTDSIENQTLPGQKLATSLAATLPDLSESKHTYILSKLSK